MSTSAVTPTPPPAVWSELIKGQKFLWYLNPGERIVSAQYLPGLEGWLVCFAREAVAR